MISIKFSENRQVVFDLKKNSVDGLPDGMTIDKNDKLWVAVFGSSSVYQIDPNNDTVLQSVKFEVPGVWKPIIKTNQMLRNFIKFFSFTDYFMHMGWTES